MPQIDEVWVGVKDLTFNVAKKFVHRPEKYHSGFVKIGVVTINNK